MSVSEQPSDFTRLIRELTELREEGEAADWTLPPEPEWLAERQKYHLGWRASERMGQGKLMGIEELRVAIPQQIDSYVETAGQQVLLVRVPAGVGKTHAAVHAAQRAAVAGLRILYCAARHNFLDDVRDIPGFDSDLWYHWLPIHKSKNEADPIPTTCRWADQQLVWLRKGYPAFDLCFQICTSDGHLAHCPFRLQRGRREPIVFAMHNHLVHGVSIGNFDLAIVDELPLQAFIKDREIPRSGLDVGATGPLGDLIEQLSALSAGTISGLIAGRQLFDVIGPTLRDVYAQVETVPQMLPVIPRVWSPDAVREVPYWYIFSLLRLASAEYDAWRAGWPRWAERVRVSRLGLHLLYRAQPWEDLPGKLVVLDATGKASIYHALFGREVEEYAPKVRRPGRIYQVTHRLNGIGSLLDEQKAPTSRARELVKISRSLADRYTGRSAVVTHKRLVPLFEGVFGEHNVLHYHALRGTNQLQDVECLIVAGGPSPTIEGVVNTATALASKRIISFVTVDDRGHERPLWTTIEREYPVTDAVRAVHGGQVPYRQIGGFWRDPDLQGVYDQFREQELVQAIHRARPNLRECDVWVLTSVPTDEPLDGVFDNPPIGPEGIGWGSWLKLQPWLEEQLAVRKTITAASVARASGVLESWVREKKWLSAIVVFDARWEVQKLTPTPTGGRPRLLLGPRAGVV